MSQSLAHMFIIWTVYDGIPVGRGGTSPWYITISSFEHTVPIWFKPPSSAMHHNFSAAILFYHYNMLVKGSRTSRLQQLPWGDYCSVSFGEKHLCNACVPLTFPVNYHIPHCSANKNVSCSNQHIWKLIFFRRYWWETEGINLTWNNYSNQLVHCIKAKQLNKSMDEWLRLQLFLNIDSRRVLQLQWHKDCIICVIKVKVLPKSMAKSEATETVQKLLALALLNPTFILISEVLSICLTWKSWRKKQAMV